MATYDGLNIFGRSVTITHVMNPTAEQTNAFFGLSGTQALYGGHRGRAFEVTGVLAATNMVDLNLAEDLFLSHVDGIARVLVDTRLRVWTDVLIDSFQPQGRVLLDFRGYYQPYKALLKGLV